MRESPEAFLKRAGIEYKKRGKEARFPCPVCQDKEGFDLNLITGQWHCLRASCGEKGNLYTLAVHLGLAYEVKDTDGTDTDDASDRLARAFQARPQEDHDRWHSLLLEGTHAEKARQYLQSRGIDETVWMRARLGWIPRPPGTGRPGTIEGAGLIAIPFFPPGGEKPSMVKLRWVPPEPLDKKGRPRRYQRIAGGESTLYTPTGLDTSKTVVLTGGELDALSLVQAAETDKVTPADSPVCPVSVPDGEGQWNDLWTQQLADAEDVVIVFDSDPAGRKGAESVSASLGSHRCRIGRWPDGHKDGNDALQAGDLSLDTVLSVVESAESQAGQAVAGAASFTDSVVAWIFRPHAKGFPTGWKSLDDLIGGFRTGEITVLTGHSGAGKTTFAIQAMHHQITEGRRCLFCPFEGGPTQTLSRLVRCHLGQPPDEAGEHEARRALADLDDLLVLDHTGTVNNAAILTTLEWTIHRKGVEFVVLDNLHFMVPRGKDRWDIQDNLILGLQMLIQRSSAHLILVAHPHKVGTGKARDDVLPQLGDLAGHSAVFQDVANVLSLYRPRTAEREDMRDEKGFYPSLVASLKQRDEHGDEGTVELKLHKEAARFLDPKGAFQTSVPF